MESVGHKIRMQRLGKNYSQEYMAFMLEISQPAYSKIERDETEISLKRLYEIAEILQVDAFTLMPPSKYSLGINYLRFKQAFYRISKLWGNTIQKRKEEAARLNILTVTNPTSQTNKLQP
jgi:transcriptional regulator with XRE-family HTH domain